MTLLEDIQNAAIDGNSDLGTLLRKCKLLAARLGSQALEDWVLWESNGYPADAAVPDYRIWAVEVKGHFSGPFGSGLRNASIPYRCLPKSVRDSYRRFNCRQSIASIEAMLSDKSTGILTVNTGDLAVILGENVYEGMNCMQAWGEFGAGRLVEAANSVRNRILDLALALWKELPEAGEIRSNATTTMEAAKVTQIFNTTVYGGAANLVGTSHASTITFNVAPNDFNALGQTLKEHSVAVEDITDLQVALGADPTPQSVNKLGPKVSAWIAKMMGKAADGTWEVSVSTAGTLLAQAISKFYGLG